MLWLATQRKDGSNGKWGGEMAWPGFKSISISFQFLSIIPQQHIFYPQPHTLNPTSTPLATTLPLFLTHPLFQREGLWNLLEKKENADVHPDVWRPLQLWEETKRERKGGGVDEDVWDGSLPSFQTNSNYSLCWPESTALILSKAALLALLNLQCRDSRYRNQQKHSTHRPSNQWGTAGLPDQSWLIKEKRTNNRGKGRVWQSGTLQKHTEKPRDRVWGFWGWRVGGGRGQ